MRQPEFDMETSGTSFIAVSISVALLAATTAVNNPGILVAILMTFWTMGLVAVPVPNHSASEVFMVRDSFKMMGINAAMHPTKMVNMQAKGNLALKQLKGYSWGSYLFAVIAHSPIAIFVNLSHPEPAAGLRDGQPKAVEVFEKWYLSSSHVIPPRIALVMGCPALQRRRGPFHCSSEVGNGSEDLRT